MPHKHKRKRGDGESNFDLPPTIHARSLPVTQPTKDFLTPRKRPKLNKQNGRAKRPIDDTPKSFARLMAWHKDGRKLASGLDDGSADKKSKRRKQQSANQKEKMPGNDAHSSNNDGTAINETKTEQPDSSTPTILPGESLAAFNIRVDQSMPLASVSKHHKVNIPGVKDQSRLTQHNKRLLRMQSEWRNTDAKVRERREEQEEAGEEKREEEKLLWMDVDNSRAKGKKRKGLVEEDPWKELEKKRAETKQKNLQDVVQAPPMLDVEKMRKMQKLFKQTRQN